MGVGKGVSFLGWGTLYSSSRVDLFEFHQLPKRTEKGGPHKKTTSCCITTFEEPDIKT